MNRLDVEVGMRVLDTGSGRYRTATIMELSRPQSDDKGPDYALLRYDSFWRREAWVHAMYLNPLQTPVPSEVKR
jgi:hypothetical protein